MSGNSKNLIKSTHLEDLNDSYNSGGVKIGSISIPSDEKSSKKINKIGESMIKTPSGDIKQISKQLDDKNEIPSRQEAIMISKQLLQNAPNPSNLSSSRGMISGIKPEKYTIPNMSGNLANSINSIPEQKLDLSINAKASTLKGINYVGGSTFGIPGDSTEQSSRSFNDGSSVRKLANFPMSDPQNAISASLPLGRIEDKSAAAIQSSLNKSVNEFKSGGTHKEFTNQISRQSDINHQNILQQSKKDITDSVNQSKILEGKLKGDSIVEDNDIGLSQMKGDDSIRTPPMENELDSPTTKRYLKDQLDSANKPFKNAKHLEDGVQNSIIGNKLQKVQGFDDPRGIAGSEVISRVQPQQQQQPFSYNMPIKNQIPGGEYNNYNSYYAGQNPTIRSNYASNSQAVTDFATIARQNKAGTPVPGVPTTLNNSIRLSAHNHLSNSIGRNQIIIAPPLVKDVLEVGQQQVNDGLVIQIGWVFLIIIGLWTFVMMVSDVIDFESVGFVKMSSIAQMVTWYSTNSDLQAAVGVLAGGVGQNYVTLVDFLVYFIASKGFLNLWLSNSYWEKSEIKSAIVLIMLLKDCLVIIFSFSASDYQLESGWTGFGVFWMNSFGKLSILISLIRIFYFRLLYFKEFGSDSDGGCKSVLRRWGINLFSWASKDGARNPDIYLVLVVAIFYLPLAIHAFVGIIQATYVLIIWVSVLMFLQIIYNIVTQICKRKEVGQPYSVLKVMMKKQKNQYEVMTVQPAVLFMILLVIIPGVATASFTTLFSQAMQYHFTGQQLALQFFSLPQSTYTSKMTFICNLLSLI